LSIRQLSKRICQPIRGTHKLTAYSVLFCQLFSVTAVYAGPSGGQVVGGTGSIGHSDLTTNITQTSSSLAINWASYNLNSNETINYIQPSASSIALNRILDSSPSQINGQINANGQVVLVNPNGIFFGSTANIDVGGLIASGLDISASDFMNSTYIFNEIAGKDGVVVNSGLIEASLGGQVTLIGKEISNEGLISAQLGTVNLAAGKQAVVTFDNNGLIGIKVTKEILQNELGVAPAVLNSGDINAAGGRVLMTGSVSQDIFSQAVNTGDINQATSVVVNPDGTFTLGSGADVVNSGKVDVSTSQGPAGQVIVLGENVASSGSIAANSGDGNGGNIELHANNTKPDRKQPYRG